MKFLLVCLLPISYISFFGMSKLAFVQNGRVPDDFLEANQYNWLEQIALITVASSLVAGILFAGNSLSFAILLSLFVDEAFLDLLIKGFSINAVLGAGAWVISEIVDTKRKQQTTIAEVIHFSCGFTSLLILLLSVNVLTPFLASF